jgi:hypothetical protein
VINLIQNLFNRKEQNPYEASFAKWHKWRKENNENMTWVSIVHNVFWKHGSWIPSPPYERTYSGEMMFELIDSLSDRQILEFRNIGPRGLGIARAVSAWSKK